ncbi:MAG: hypothetical protein KAR06_01840 [Deltaproteobacteria bacterium]|nr:hypothetical protein [Deltaproteobacteria bacterium]
MADKAGSFIKGKGGKLIPNDNDHAMKERRSIKEKAAKEAKAKAKTEEKKKGVTDEVNG